MDSPLPTRSEPTRNLATIQRGWDAFNAQKPTLEAIRHGDFAPVLEAFDRGIVWEVTDLGIPGMGTYYGHRGVRQFWIDWFEVVGDVQTNVLELQAASDKVMCVCRQTGSGVASGAAVTWEFSMVFTMRDGRAVRTEMYADADDARRAAGLQPTAVPEPS